VVSGVTGVFVKSRDPQSIAAGTQELLSDDRRRAAMGRAGAERVRDHYTWQRIAEQTERSYRRAQRSSRELSSVAASG
jgi:D-inositol-3-phosphate glycosyltransferase